MMLYNILSLLNQIIIIVQIYFVLISCCTATVKEQLLLHCSYLSLCCFWKNIRIAKNYCLKTRLKLAVNQATIDNTLLLL